MTTRQIRDRLGSILNPPEVTTPAEELAEPRNVAPGAEISGHLLAHHLEIPEGLGPDWAPLLITMREGMSEAVGRVVAELEARGRPEPLVNFTQATAVDGVPTMATFARVPLAAVWEITNVFVLHAEAADEVIELLLEPGGQIDALTVPADVGASPGWAGPLYVREGVRLAVAAAAGALTQGSRLEVAIFGRIHSTREG